VADTSQDRPVRKEVVNAPFTCFDAGVPRFDWFVFGGWALIVCYLLGIWALAAFSFLLLSRTF
jgi:hypothetical protein